MFYEPQTFNHLSVRTPWATFTWLLSNLALLNLIPQVLQPCLCGIHILSLKIDLRLGKWDSYLLEAFLRQIPFWSLPCARHSKQKGSSPKGMSLETTKFVLTKCWLRANFVPKFFPHSWHLLNTFNDLLLDNVFFTTIFSKEIKRIKYKGDQRTSHLKKLEAKSYFFSVASLLSLF